MPSCPYTEDLECCIGSGDFIGGRGEGAGSWEGLEPPSQTFSTPPPDICLDDTINILIFRVRPHACILHERHNEEVYTVSSSDQLTSTDSVH